MFRRPTVGQFSCFAFTGSLKKLNFALKTVAKETRFHIFLVVPFRSQSVGVVIDFVKTVTDVDSYSVGGVLNKLPLHHLSPQQVL